MTIEDLAGLMQRTMASKEDVKELRIDMKESFDEVFTRLERIEKHVLERHEARIDRLEEEVKEFARIVAWRVSRSGMNETVLARNALF